MDSRTSDVVDDGQPTDFSVFLSYSRGDQKQALVILHALEQAGYSVWWDGLLEGGEQFHNVTETALENAKAVVVLWSKTSSHSHWVHDEATRARDTGRLVPMSIDGVAPPLGFGQFQCIDASAHGLMPGSEAIQKLLHAVSVLCHSEPLPVAQHKPEKLTISRRMLISAAAVTVMGGGGLAYWKTGLFDSSSNNNSIAVLSFVNLSGDPAQQYFSDGLASEIRTELSHNPLLQIIGQTSSANVSRKNGDGKQIAEQLGVAFLLGGNVQRDRDRVKIALDLNEGKTGVSRWAQIFERPIADIFAVQSEIATAVAAALSVAIDASNPNRRAPQIGGTQSVAAFDSFLRGKEIFELHIDENSERQALAKFDDAIAIDPEYAAARAAKAHSLAVIANQYVDGAGRIKLYDQAIREATRATEIEPAFAGGYNALGYGLFYGRLEVAGAREPYDRAYRLDKNDVDVLNRFAIYCARTGRQAEAAAAISRALILDPLNSSVFKSAGSINYAAGRYDEAIKLGHRAIALSPERSTLHGGIGDAYLMLGNLGLAAKEYAAESSNLSRLPGQAVIADRAGNKAGAAKALADLVSEFGDNSLYQQAQIHAQLGDKDRAFATLKRAKESYDSGLVYLLKDPFLEPLRDDTRYRDLLSALTFT